MGRPTSVLLSPILTMLSEKSEAVPAQGNTPTPCILKASILIIEESQACWNQCSLKVYELLDDEGALTADCGPHL